MFVHDLSLLFIQLFPYLFTYLPSYSFIHLFICLFTYLYTFLIFFFTCEFIASFVRSFFRSLVLSFIYSRFFVFGAASSSNNMGWMMLDPNCLQKDCVSLKKILISKIEIFVLCYTSNEMFWYIIHFSSPWMEFASTSRQCHTLYRWLASGCLRSRLYWARMWAVVGFDEKKTSLFNDTRKEWSFVAWLSSPFPHFLFFIALWWGSRQENTNGKNLPSIFSLVHTQKIALTQNKMYLSLLFLSSC